MRGGLLGIAITLAAALPARADIDPPWGFPRCPQSANPIQKESRYFPQPLAFNRQQYTLIYNAFEKQFAPFAPFFYPALNYEEHRDWVRITRNTGTKDGRPPKQKVYAYGNWVSANANIVPISMRINKCDGSMSEVFWDRDRVK